MALRRWNLVTRESHLKRLQVAYSICLKSYFCYTRAYGHKCCLSSWIQPTHWPAHEYKSVFLISDPSSEPVCEFIEHVRVKWSTGGTIKHVTCEWSLQNLCTLHRCSGCVLPCQQVTQEVTQEGDGMTRGNLYGSTQWWTQFTAHASGGP